MQVLLLYLPTGISKLLVTNSNQTYFQPFGVIAGRDSMFSAFRLGLSDSGRGLCDIDRALFRVTKSHSE